MRTEKLELDERFGNEYAGCYVAIQAETIWASLKEQSKNNPVTLEKLLSKDGGVPIGMGKLFSQVVNKLNNVGLEETRFLSGQSEDKNQT